MKRGANDVLPPSQNTGESVLPSVPSTYHQAVTSCLPLAFTPKLLMSLRCGEFSRILFPSRSAAPKLDVAISYQMPV